MEIESTLYNPMNILLIGMGIGGVGGWYLSKKLPSSIEQFQDSISRRTVFYLQNPQYLHIPTNLQMPTILQPAVMKQEDNIYKILENLSNRLNSLEKKLKEVSK